MFVILDISNINGNHEGGGTVPIHEHSALSIDFREVENRSGRRKTEKPIADFTEKINSQLYSVGNSLLGNCWDNNNV